MKKATDLLVQCLEDEGVEYIFGIMGKETLDLIDSLSQSKKSSSFMFVMNKGQLLWQMYTVG